MKKRMTKKQLIEFIMSQEDSKEQMEAVEDMLIESQVSIDVNKVDNNKLTFGEKMSDNLASFAGSWRFIIFFFTFMLFWILANLYLLSKPFDAFPFILLNLMLSCLAAIQAPIIMMSQNRQEARDRIRSENDYKVNLKSELLLEGIHRKIEKVLVNQSLIKTTLNIIEKDVE